MVNMIIDGKHISAEENITIMEAAERNGIPIPKLCYLKGINEIAACRVCVVELEGKEKLITSCNNVVKDGLRCRAYRFGSPPVYPHAVPACFVTMSGSTDIPGLLFLYPER